MASFSFSSAEILECSVLVLGVAIVSGVLIKKYYKKNFSNYSQWNRLFQLQLCTFVSTALYLIAQLVFLLYRVYFKSITGVASVETVGHWICSTLTVLGVHAITWFDISANFYKYKRVVLAAKDKRSHSAIKVVKGVAVFLIVLSTITNVLRGIANVIQNFGMYRIMHLIYIISFALLLLGLIFADLFTSVKMMLRVLSTMKKKRTTPNTNPSIVISNNVNDLPPSATTSTLGSGDENYDVFKTKLILFVVTITVIDIIALGLYLAVNSIALPAFMFSLHPMASFEFLVILKSEVNDAQRNLTSASDPSISKLSSVAWNSTEAHGLPRIEPISSVID